MCPIKIWKRRKFFMNVIIVSEKCVENLVIMLIISLIKFGKTNMNEHYKEKYKEEIEWIAYKNRI